MILLFIFLDIKNNKEVSKGSEETENFEEEVIEYFEAEKSDFKDLENMLKGLNYIADLEFDSSTVNFEDIFLCLISDSYYFFEDTAEEIYDDSDKKADPQKKLYRYDVNEEKDKYSYFKLKGNDIDWISKNIYNIEPNHSIDMDTLYYDNGNFYILASDGYVYYDDGYTISCKNEKYTVDIMNYKHYKNGRYYITVEYSYNSDERSINYMEAALKNIDGRRQWTIYKNSAYQFNFDEKYGEIVEYKELNPIYYDYYKNKDKDKDKKIEENTDTHSQSSSRLYTDEEVFEEVKKVIKSKENSQWGVIESHSFGNLEACTYDKNKQIYTLYFRWDNYVLSGNYSERYKSTAICQQENGNLNIIRIYSQRY